MAFTPSSRPPKCSPLDPNLVRMERAVNQRVKRPDWFPDGFIKLDGAPDVEFHGYQYFAFATEHSDFTDSGVIGNPLRGTLKRANESTTYSPSTLPTRWRRSRLSR